MPSPDAVLSAQQTLRDILPTLEPVERALVLDTDLGIADVPSKNDLRLAKVPDGRVLLGIFTAPPARITIFERNVAAAGASIREVLLHELGHRVGHDHKLEEIAVAHVGAPVGGAIGATRQDADEDPHVGDGAWGRNCPVCLLHQRLAEADRLLAGLADASAMQHRIPVGLGGTIPLARHDLVEAAALVPIVAQMMPGRLGQVRAVGDAIARAQGALEGTLDAQGVQRAAAAVHAAWRLGYSAAWAFFAAGRR